MNVRKRYCLLACLCLLCSLYTKAQINLAANSLLYSTEEQGALLADSTSLFSIKDIVIEGNNHTKNYIILRELAFKKGEGYPLNELVDKFTETKQQLMNTGLFRNVVVSLKSLQGYDVSVSIEVKERWYIYPIPLVKIVDRDINDWVKQNMSLDHVNYGIKLTHKNLTGRNDKLYVNLVNGFTKQVAMRYDGLYLDKKLKWSANISFAFGKNHEVVYNTIHDRQVSYKNNDQYVHSFFRSLLEFTYRRAIKTRNTFGIAYNYEDVADTIFHLNPKYSAQRKVIRYPEINYRLQHYDVDAIPYPTKGYIADVSLVKKGFCSEINLWQIGAMGSAYWPLNSKYIFNARVAGMIKMPFHQQFVTKQFLGYNNMFMQGYEYNVIDGVAGGYGKAVLARQLVNRSYHIASKKIDRLNSFAFAMYAKVYGNAGYIYNPDPGPNYLSNRLLYSGGVGLDIILFSDFVIKLEYSANQFSQKGLYLHKRDYF